MNEHFAYVVGVIRRKALKLERLTWELEALGNEPEIEQEVGRAELPAGAGQRRGDGREGQRRSQGSTESRPTKGVEAAARGGDKRKGPRGGEVTNIVTAAFEDLPEEFRLRDLVAASGKSAGTCCGVIARLPCRKVKPGLYRKTGLGKGNGRRGVSTIEGGTARGAEASLPVVVEEETRGVVESRPIKDQPKQFTAARMGESMGDLLMRKRREREAGGGES